MNPRIVLALLFAASAPAPAAPAAPAPAAPAPAIQAAPAPAIQNDDAAASPLLLSEVLRSSARAAPQIVEALARTRGAEGRALSAQGAFDTVFDVDARSRLLGYYDGTVVEGRATRPLTTNGGYLYGGYRASRGDFPIYEDAAYTNRLGEVKVGALYALLRDRLVDERRTRVALARGDIDIARFDAAAVAIGVQRRAVDAYQNWVAAGLRLGAYGDLLALAERRRGALERQVALGARPQVLLLENDQNVLRRRALVIRTEQELRAAANALSLYLRDERGAPLVVGVERLPQTADALAGLLGTGSAALVAADRRPDRQAVLARTEQALARLLLAENELKPRLDLRGELGQDLGREGLGGPSRSGTEAIVGFRLSVPLERRGAKGRIAEASAEIDALGARRRFIDDQIAVEVQGVDIAVGGAERLLVVADQERVLAERLAAAERRRFELGSGDFFLVNQREETATDAAVRQVDAQARVAAARAELATATADREALGLEP